MKNSTTNPTKNPRRIGLMAQRRGSALLLAVPVLALSLFLVGCPKRPATTAASAPAPTGAPTPSAAAPSTTPSPSMTPSLEVSRVDRDSALPWLGVLLGLTGQHRF